MRLCSEHGLIIRIGLLIPVLFSILMPVPYPVRLTGAVLLVLLPGYALANALHSRVGNLLERFVLGVALSYAIMVLLSLLILYTLGNVTKVSITIALGTTYLVLSITSLYRSIANGRTPHLDIRDFIATCACVAVAGFLALANLSYADYWGDEMNGLLRAVAMISGHGEIIFKHTKGPVEILIPAVFGLLVERWDPFTVRLPFALAYIVGSISFYFLVRRMFDQKVAFLASFLLIINGLYLAFGRIVQYQAAVYLFSIPAIASAHRFYRDGQAAYLNIAALLSGVGLLAHYDTLLTLPVIGYLVWCRFRQNHTRWIREWPHLILAGVLLLVVIFLFYLPFAIGPALAKTSSYLSGRIGSWPTSNIDALHKFTLLYNSSYYVAFIALAGALRLLTDLWHIAHQSESKLRWFLIFAFISGFVAVMLVDRVDLLPLLLCCIVFIPLIAKAPGGVECRAMYIWFAVSFIGYIFLVDHPRTHLRVIYPPWLALGALMIVNLMRLQSVSGNRAKTAHDSPQELLVTSRRWANWRTRASSLWSKSVTVATIGGLCLLGILFTSYQYLLFADTRAEYVFTYPENKNPLYWEDPAFPFGSRRPYGMPHRLGWQMIQQRFLDGTLQGDWDSNDYGANLFWYTLGWPRNPCYPRYYFAARFQQKETDDEPTQPAFKLDHYTSVGQIWNRGRLQIEVYEFNPLCSARQPAIWIEPEIYTTFVTPADFRALPFVDPTLTISNPFTSPAIFQPSPMALQHIADYYGDARITQVRDKVALMGYDLDTQWARPGGVLVLTLYWQAVEVVNLPYKVFVHLVDTASARTVTQADDLPACGTRPTPRWRVGEIVPDRHIVELPDDLAAGEYLLRVGLYEPQTQQRMDLLDVAGHPQGTSLEVATIELACTYR